MEAWEELAPELPPGWGILTDGIGWHDIYQHQGAFVTKSPPGRSRRMAWEAFGITRKRYAKLIAVERVRVVVRATGKYNNCTLEHHDFIAAGSVLHKIRITDVDSYEEVFTVDSWGGPTICDAAWACIKALGGGE